MKKWVKSEIACEQKLIVRERESARIFLDTSFHQQPCPPPKCMVEDGFVCVSRVKLRVHFLPRLFMRIEGNIVYVLQIFPRKKGGLLCSGDESPSSLFHAI